MAETPECYAQYIEYALFFGIFVFGVK